MKQTNELPSFLSQFSWFCPRFWVNTSFRTSWQCTRLKLYAPITPCLFFCHVIIIHRAPVQGLSVFPGKSLFRTRPKVGWFWVLVILWYFFDQNFIRAFLFLPTLSDHSSILIFYRKHPVSSSLVLTLLPASWSVFPFTHLLVSDLTIVWYSKLTPRLCWPW